MTHRVIQCEIGLHAVGIPGLCRNDHRAGGRICQGTHVKQGLRRFPRLGRGNTGCTRREHCLTRGFDHLAGELASRRRQIILDPLNRPGHGLDRAAFGLDFGVCIAVNDVVQ